MAGSQQDLCCEALRQCVPVHVLLLQVFEPGNGTGLGRGMYGEISGRVARRNAHLWSLVNCTRSLELSTHEHDKLQCQG